MNRWQRLVLSTAAGAIAVVLLFPPFALQGTQGTMRNMGRAFVLSPPPDFNHAAIIDTETLATQILGLLAVTALLYFAFRDK